MVSAPESSPFCSPNCLTEVSVYYFLTVSTTSFCHAQALSAGPHRQVCANHSSTYYSCLPWFLVAGSRGATEDLNHPYRQALVDVVDPSSPSGRKITPHPFISSHHKLLHSAPCPTRPKVRSGSSMPHVWGKVFPHSSQSINADQNHNMSPHTC